MKKIGIILLAAGAGKRFGGNKLTAMVEGKPMYLRAMDALKNLPFALPPVIVTGNPVIAYETKKRGWLFVLNDKPELGISRSVRLGIEEIRRYLPDVTGILFMVCDQPWIRGATLNRMMTVFDGGILALNSGGRLGNPVIFSRDYLGELCRLTGDVGGRQVMERHPEDVKTLSVNEKELQDIDRREQLEKMGGKMMETIYLDQAAAVVPKAEGVEEAEASAAALNADSAAVVIEETRERLNGLFHGPGADSVVFTPGVGAALDVTIRALLKEGDHVLVSPLESDDVMEALNAIGHETGTEGSGVEYTKLPCNEKGQLILFDAQKGEKVFDTVEKHLRPNTKAIIINHGSEVCGSILQVKELGEFAKRHGLLMIVNTAQTACFVPIFMNIWGIDVLAFSGGFGLLASEKIGGFIASDRAAEMLGGADMRKNFEQNPLDVAAVAGLHKAFDFIEATRLYTLSSVAQKRAEQFIRKVQHVNGVHIIGPGYKDRIPVVSIQTDFMDEAELEKTLNEKYGIVMQSGYHRAVAAHQTLNTYPRGTARFSFTYFTTEEDIDKITQALWQLTVQSDKIPDVVRMPKE